VIFYTNYHVSASINDYLDNALSKKHIHYFLLENMSFMSSIEFILTRRSIRKYKKKDIAENTFAQIIEAGRRAPSAVNKQPVHFIIVKDTEVKKNLAIFPFNRFVKDAPAVVVGCADVTSLLTGKWAIVDVAIAMQNMVIAGGLSELALAG
jgi:nitroreductase